MPVTQLGGRQVADSSIQRTDLDAITPGQAVIRKVLAGEGITLSSTGVDSGTGDVMISLIKDKNPVFTYTNGLVSRIDYDNGRYKLLFYTNGILTTLSYLIPNGIFTPTEILKTFNYDLNGNLTSITEMEIN